MCLCSFIPETPTYSYPSNNFKMSAPNDPAGPTDIETRLFINGEFVPSKLGKTFDVVNPATEKITASPYEATAEDVDLAVEAAKAALPAWSEMGGFGRAGFFYKLADLVEKANTELAQLDAVSMGRPISTYSKSLKTLEATNLGNSFSRTNPISGR
jgi:aldehyde dehydrogenase (NAD+)